MSIVQVDPTSEVSVTTLLENARTWIAQAVENSTPLEIAFAKAQIATAAEATKQLNLSKEIQLDAQEMVRRAEYALGKAIRKGQADGSVRARGFVGPQEPYYRNGTLVAGSARGGDPDPNTMSPKSLTTSGEELHQVYTMSDDVSPEQFDDVIDQAKAEGNLSRANVVRKIKQQVKPRTRDSRADLITTLANQGYSSRQMPSKVGVTEESVRQIARDYGIDIPADRSISRTRRINSTQIVVNTATALEGLVSGIELIDFDALDLDEASQWAASLTDSVKKLARFAQQIRKATQ